MNLLLLGSGGREHALAWKLRQSRGLKRLFVAPGNAGTGTLGTNVALAINNFEDVKRFVLENDIDMVVVGPEEPLVNGIHDFFLNDNLLHNVSVIGPCSHGALLEGSKAFAKDFMERHSIPTAAYKTFSVADLEGAIQFLQSLQPPFVLKADGLAAGKGVLICNDIQTAEEELIAMLQAKKFGRASEKVVIEQFLQGIELSVFVITDGNSYKILPEAKDYKRVGNNDTGPNTGGMGAVSPVIFATEEFMQKVEERIVKPTIEGLKKENISYKGFIFFGLIKVGNDPYVIEYNCRLGDPESEVILPRLQNDLLELFMAVADQHLDTITINIDSQYAAAVMLVSGGYPGEYLKGKNVKNLHLCDGSLIFHAGTACKENTNEVITSGGRVFSITSTATTLQKALEISYTNAKKISFEGKYFRNDIGYDLLKMGK
ncbi:MAG: phosphoribosylamine--glycine ligase [Lentimicrobiaceae bacterium]|nr:phosphoribosylamine--glycine ligase [Lentimicrobiaceae bacterium]